MNLASNVKTLRKKKGWSQTDLADKTGTTLSHINKIETGKYKPSFEALVALAKALEVSLDDLVYGQAADLEMIHLENATTLQLARMIDNLNTKERDAIIVMLENILTSRKFLSLASSTESLSKELAAVK